jgi:hypothetical protein
MKRLWTATVVATLLSCNCAYLLAGWRDGQPDARYCRDLAA